MTTTLIDATPVTSAPPNLPSLSPGQFTFPMAPAISVRSACLEKLEQKSCWACASGVPLALEVSTSDATATRVTLNSSYDNDRPKYGPFPPEMVGTVPVQLVLDTDQPGRGPAYLFQQTINKTVVLHEDALNASTSPQKRDWDDLEALAELHPRANTFAQPGEKPWFCFWNNTMLQGFIYVTIDANEQGDVSLASSVATAAPTLATAAATAAAAPSAAGLSPSVPTPTTTAPAYVRRGDHDAAKYALASTSSSTAPVAAATASASGAWPSNLPPAYPKAIKLEERRIPGVSSAPYCQQMQILDDYGLGPLPDRTIQLEETESTRQHRMVYGQRHRKYRRDKRSIMDDNYCACVWLGQ